MTTDESTMTWMAKNRLDLFLRKDILAYISVDLARQTDVFTHRSDGTWSGWSALCHQQRGSNIGLTLPMNSPGQCNE